MIDFHTHLLPGMDDGSKCMEESLNIVKRQYSKGVFDLVVTPHFYPDDEVSRFVEAREATRSMLAELLKTECMDEVKLYTAAEVLVSVDTYKNEQIHKLCIEGTDYLLLEMPHSRWSDWVYASIEDLIRSRRIRPIIAHVERYDDVMDNPNKLMPFIEMGALLQVNVQSLDKNSSRSKLANSLVKRGMIHLLGSDVHRQSSFLTVNDGYQMIEATHGAAYAQAMADIGAKVLRNEAVRVERVKPYKKLLGKWY